MLRIHLFLASVALICTPSPVLLGAEQITPAAKSVAPVSAPGWMVIDEDLWIRFIDEPSHYMNQAHSLFLKKEYGPAAMSMRKSAGYLHIDAHNAMSTTKASLTASAEELDVLATDIQAGKLRSVSELESAFARAEHALAADRLAKARFAFKSMNHAKTGHYLSSAVAHVENGAKWVGHGLESGALAMANGFRMLSGKLIEGSGFAVDEAGKGISWVGEEVEKLGKYLEPYKQAKAPSLPVTKK